MGRIYVPSTPATRGEVSPEKYAAQQGDQDLTLEQLQAAAAKLGYQVAIQPAPDPQSAGQQTVPDGQQSTPASSDLPAGNASAEDWTAYALAHGKTEADLNGEDGKPLGRDAIKALFVDTPAK